jgi:hypothetical protein
LGRAIYVLSTTTVILGMFRLDLGLPVVIVYAIGTACTIFFYFYIDIYKRVSGDLDQSHEETQKLLGVNTF